MAVSYGSSVTRMEVYESLFLISQATQQIADHLERLKSAKMLAPMFAEIQKLAAYERQAARDVFISYVRSGQSAVYVCT